MGVFKVEKGMEEEGRILPADQQWLKYNSVWGMFKAVQSFRTKLDKIRKVLKDE